MKIMKYWKKSMMGLYLIKYIETMLFINMVYLPELKMTNRFTVDMIKKIIAFNNLKYIYLQMKIDSKEK